MQTSRVSACPNCGSANQYRTRKPVSGGGGYAPNYLPGLGRLLTPGKFSVVVCHDCGLTRWFAQRAATERLADSSRWGRA